MEMRDPLVIGSIVLALVLAVAALLWAEKARRRAESAIRRADRHRTVVPPQAVPIRSEPWRGGLPQEAPEWISQSFSTVHELITDLQGEIVRLKAEVQQLSKSGAPRLDSQRRAGAPAAEQREQPAGQAVDLREGMVVPSRALAAPGFLVVGGADEAALLYLNEEVEIDHLAWDRWVQFFDFGGGEPYRRYRTVQPSRVEWSAAAEQGRLLSRGKAEEV